MKIWELDLTDGKKYRVIGERGDWEFLKGHLYNEDCYVITDCYAIKELLSLDFEEVVDWSEVEVDTPILVSNSSDDEQWRPRHFAKYELGNVYAWADGRTSHTSRTPVGWEYAKLIELKK